MRCVAYGTIKNVYHVEFFPSFLFRFGFSCTCVQFFVCTQTSMWPRTSRLFFLSLVLFAICACFNCSLAKAYANALFFRFWVAPKIRTVINVHTTDQLLSVVTKCMDNAITTIIININEVDKIDKSTVLIISHFAWLTKIDCHIRISIGYACNLCLLIIFFFGYDNNQITVISFNYFNT